MSINILKYILSSIIVVCSFASMYSESTDYEYTNQLEIDEKALSAENIEDLQKENPDLVINLDNINLNTSDEISDAQSNHDVLDAINQAEESGNMSNLNVDFSNYNIYESYNYMKQINNQTMAWLYIPNQGSYPVMYSGDNSFYLTHSPYGYYHENGAIFMNSNTNGKFENAALLHGHHLRTGGMFGSLKKYKDKQYFQTNDLVEVFDGTYLRYYRPFSVFFYEDGVEVIRQSFTDDNDKQQYLESLYQKSMVPMKSGYSPRYDSDVLYLSTCDYEFENCRLCVALYCVTSVQYQD